MTETEERHNIARFLNCVELITVSLHSLTQQQAESHRELMAYFKGRDRFEDSIAAVAKQLEESK